MLWLRDRSKLFEGKGSGNDMGSCIELNKLMSVREFEEDVGVKIVNVQVQSGKINTRRTPVSSLLSLKKFEWNGIKYINP